MQAPPTRSNSHIKILAWALPSAAALGSNLPGVGPLFGFRILTLVVVVVAVAYPAETSKRGLSKPLSALAVGWIVVGLLLSLIAVDGSAAFRTMTSISLGLLLALACVRIMRSEPRLMGWLAQGWFLSFVLTGSIAVWELSTGEHLANYFLPAGVPGGQLPAATFFNPNAFAIYLVCVQAMILWSLGRTGRPLVRVLLFASSAWCAFLIMTTGSRLSLAAFVLLTIGFLAIDRMSLTRALLVSAVVGVIIWFTVPSVGAAISMYMPEDVRSTSLSQSMLGLENSETTEGRRLELYKSSIWLVGASWGLGVGPGNFGAALSQYDVPYETGGTLSPHSFVGELAAEFGIPVLVGFGLFTWSLVRRVMPHRGRERSALLATGMAFILAGLANSGYLLASTMWMFFATMLCMVVLAELQPANRPEDGQ